MTTATVLNVLAGGVGLALMVGPWWQETTQRRAWSFLAVVVALVAVAVGLSLLVRGGAGLARAFLEWLHERDTP